MGVIQSMVLSAVFTGIFFIGLFGFFTLETQVSSLNPNPPYSSNTTIPETAFISSLNNFMAHINHFQEAIANIVPQSGIMPINVWGFFDTGYAVLQLLTDIPMLIGSFIYDLVHMFLIFLPAKPSLELLAMINLIVIIPIISILFILISSIRPPSLKTY